MTSSRAPSPTASSTSSTPMEPVAVVGIASVMPGSKTVRGYWSDIVQRTDRLTEVPRTHWLVEDHYHPTPGTPDKVYTKKGGFLPAMEFAPFEYGLPPNAVPATDTAQLLALLVAKEALHEATRGQLADVPRDRISVILGVATATELTAHMSRRLDIPLMLRALRSDGVDDGTVVRVRQTLERSYVPWQENTFPGMLANVVAGRIANRFDLGGSNYVVDAACAGSLAALAAGLRELQTRDADLVLTGGVDTLNDILMFMCFAQTGALSHSSRCRPFSADADGTMLGEGVAMLALKRLADAERDGDAVYAVLRGIGSSSDGRAKSIYAPRPAGQAAAMKRAYERAGYGPETVELVEAHGTATRAGDLAELESTSSVFAAARRRSCALGSVKSQIGHTKATAGAAGLLKAILAVHHKVLPATIGVDRPNPAFAFDESPFYLNTDTRPWLKRAAAATPRRASVSAFGFGGTNFHVTLEEYRGDRRPPRLRAVPAELILLSADDAPSLAQRCRDLAAELGAPPAHVADADLLMARAFASQQRFDARAPARLALVARTGAAAAASLVSAASRISEAPAGSSWSTPDGLSVSLAAPLQGKVAFLFPGQGSQGLGMGGSLAVHVDACRAVLDDLATVAFSEGGPTLADRIFPPPAFDDDMRARQRDELTATEWAQPAVAVTSLAMLAFARSLGLQPDAVCGHSLGELTALCASGAIGEEALLRLARRRGELMAAAKERGAMLALSCSLDEARGVVAATEGVVLANHNAPRQVVLSGTLAGIDAVEAAAKARGITAKRLAVSTAFHSPLVSDAAAPLRAYLEGVEVRSPTVPVIGNASAAPYPGSAAAIRETLAAQVTSPVRFVESVERLVDDGVRVFVEVGPGDVLTQLVGAALDGRPHVAVALERRGKDGYLSAVESVGKLAVAGVSLRFDALWEGEAPPRDPLTAERPKLALSIDGGNYDKPLPPEPLPAGLARAPSAQPSPPSATMTTPTPTPTPTPIPMTMTTTTSSMTAAPSSPPTAIRAAPPSALPAMPAGVPLPAAALPATATATATATAGGAYAALIETQMEFQRLMTEAHLGFLRAVTGAAPAEPASLPVPPSAPVEVRREIPATTWPTAPVSPPQARGAEPAERPSPSTSNRVLPAGAPPPAASAPVARAPVPAAAPVDLVASLLAIVAEKTGYPAKMLEVTMDLEGDLGIDSIKRVEILSAVRERVPDLPVIDPAKMGQLRTLQDVVALLSAGRPPAPRPSPAASPALDLVGLMLTVVADKTGYPAEMLELSMDLEGDLGIDSIKRVEILSTLRERVPQLPEIDPAKMSALRTLQQIVDHLSALAPAASPPTPSIAAPPSAPAPIATAPRSAATSVTPNLSELVLGVVAEKTGYPAEMLELSMDLEGDLGIDSIKRVEILSTVRDRAPGLPELDPSTLGSLRTLQAIIAAIDAGAPPAPDKAQAVAPAAAAATTVPPSTVECFVVEDVPALPTGLACGRIFEGPIVVMPPSPLATALVARLVDEGVKARVGAGVASDTSGLIFLGGLLASAAEEKLAAARVAFSVARALAPRLRDRGGLFVAVQDTMSGGGTLAGALDAGLSGLVKTAGHEWPEASVKTIDIELAGRTADEAAAALAAELLHGGTEREVRLPAGRPRETRRSRKAHASGLPPVPGAAAVGRDDVIVVSGGGRGVTSAIVVALARRRHPRFVLLGTTPLVEESDLTRAATGREALVRVLLDEERRLGQSSGPRELGRHADRILASREIRGTLSALAAADSEALYVTCDVRNAEEVGAAVAQGRQRFGRITGILHGAGVIADALLEQKSDEQFDRVFFTKVDGMRALLAATESDPLRLVALISSIAGFAGNAGQADYAMANAVLDAAARAEARRRGRGCRVVALAYGPWQGGMVTPTLGKHFEERGVRLIPLREGAEATVDQLLGDGSSSPCLLVLAGADERRAEALRSDVVVSARRTPQLADHRVQGTPVVPVAMVVEWLARLSLAGSPDPTSPWYLGRFHVDRGVTVPDLAHPLILSLAARWRDGHHTVEVTDAQGARRFSGVLSRSSSSVVARRVARPGEERVIDRLYGDDRLFHGPRFQVLKTIEVSPHGASATLYGTAAQAWPAEPWVTDPAAIDGALQTAFLWSQEMTGRQALPLGIDEVIVHSPGALPPGPLKVELSGRSTAADRTVSDIVITNEADAPLVTLVGVQLYAVPTTTSATGSR